MTLKAKLVLFSTVSIALALGASSWAFYLAEKHRLEENYWSQRQSLVKSLQTVGRSAILGEDLIPLLRFIQNLKESHAEIAWCGVQRHGSFIAHNDGSEIGRNRQDSFSQNASSADGLLEQFYDSLVDGKMAGISELSAPIMAGSAKIAVVRIGFLKNILDENIRRSLSEMGRTIAQIALLSLAFAGLGSYWIAQKVAGKVGQLVKGVRALASGNFSLQNLPTGADEVGALSAEFAAMARRLEESMSRLSDQSEQLARANQNLKELHAMKNFFFSMANHELRSPLTSIKGYTSLLKEGRAGPLSEKQIEYVGFLDEESLRLEKLVNELLDLSRIDSDKFKMDKRPIDIPQILEPLIQKVRMECESAGVQWVCEMDPDLPLIHADSGRLVQVIANLTENALKYTPSGGRIEFHVNRLGPTAMRGLKNELSGEAALFRVKDNGQGLPKESLDKIFQRYVQLESPGEKKGLGLGLVIAKEIVTRHNGEIWVESEGLGKGAEFSVVVPVHSS